MPINPHYQQLVKESFAKVEPIAKQAAEIFYKQLFSYDPALKKLFKKPLDSQGEMLMSTLKLAVGMLDNPDKLVKTLQSLAERHTKYGVSIDDYTPVGNALLHTLKQGLGDDFTPEVRAAWVALYQVIANVMRSHVEPSFDPQSYTNHKSYSR